MHSSKNYYFFYCCYYFIVKTLNPGHRLLQSFWTFMLPIGIIWWTYSSLRVYNIILPRKIKPIVAPCTYFSLEKIFLITLLSRFCRSSKMLIIILSQSIVDRFIVRWVTRTLMTTIDSYGSSYTSKYLN